MSLRLVHCPFCGKRFNVTAIAPGTRLKCVGCTAVLTVPRPDQVALPPVRASRTLAIQVAGGLAAGLLAATALWFLVLRSPSGAPPDSPAAGTAVEKPPATPPGPPEVERVATVPPAPEELARERIYREFRSAFTFLERRPYLLAVESSQRYLGADLIEDYARRLETLHDAFRREFGEALSLRDVNDVLPVIVLNSRESFERYVLERERRRMASPIKGIYEYRNKRIVVYHDAKAPYEVIFHEGVHQLVHHYTLRESELARPPASYWFQEGLGSYFEGFRLLNGQPEIDPTADRKRLGILRPALVQEGKEFIPLTVLVGMTVDDFWDWFNKEFEKDPDEAVKKAHVYYAQSWALVYFLRQKGGNHLQAFDDYFRVELQGKGGRTAFEEIVRRHLDMELADLHAEWRDYLLQLR